MQELKQVWLEVPAEPMMVWTQENVAPDEVSLRRSLGIPTDAARVLVFAESSHWDPDWLRTSDDYYDRFVQRNLDLAISGLLRDPRRVYSLECVFFLRMYWEQCPSQRETIRTLINERRLRLTHTGVTTADTLLPDPEALLRDFLLGQEWLRRNGMTQEPDVAYFSDSFGSSPSLPSLLQAAGVHRTAITRIDGMYFLGLERNNRKTYPRRGSSAERLLTGERTLDFLWRDRAGAQVLCHWNAFTYGQGDLLAYRGLSRNCMLPLAIPDRSDRNVAGRIRKFAKMLLPYSRTPYMFCPIGFDFVAPIPDLVSLLDRYNEKYYPATGIWALNAGLDDYLDLVSCHRDLLPVVELDPNPYWTGFYTSRPALKKRCHQLVSQLQMAEQLSFLPRNSQSAYRLNGDLDPAWWSAATASHHDFITGTSPNRVVEREQIPWLEKALGVSAEKIQQLTPDFPQDHPSPGTPRIPRWRRRDGVLEIRTRHYAVDVAEEAGGAIIRAEHEGSHVSFLNGLSNDVIGYRDSGGLWRMGCEFRGGTWKEKCQASHQQAEMEVQERNGGLEVSWVSVLDGETIQRRMWFRADSPIIHFRVTGCAPKRYSVTVRFSTDIAADRLLMDTPGGVVSRPRERIYSPTFWPFQRFVHIRDRASGQGLALYQSLPGAVSCESNGTIQLVALRNALRERAYGLLPLSGNPARGYEKDPYTFDYAIEFTPRGDWQANDLPCKAYAQDSNPWQEPRLSRLRELLGTLATIDPSDVWVMACKPAMRGEGRILRLYTLTRMGQPVWVRVEHPEVEQAFLCDVRERDIQPLEVRDGSVCLTMPGTIASLRLLP